MRRQPRRAGEAVLRYWLRHFHPGMCAKDLARAVGASPVHVRAYLSGRAVPRPGTMRKLMAFTALPAGAFVFPFDGPEAW